jgi:single-stranded-DNA-specific exonuclease
MTFPKNVRSRRWQIAPPLPHSVQQEFAHIHPVLTQVLYNRGLVQPAHVQAFLEGRYLESTDPFLLPEMDKAVDRIKRAIELDEIITVYGDFDADGVTSTVLLVEALRGLGLPRQQVQPYIPDRVDEGYGLNQEALAALKARGSSLVITVDCGIRSVAEVDYANSIGLDMIVTDHHSFGPELPAATAVINPKHPSSRYPEAMLAGVGIAYKLAQALRLTMPKRALFDEADLLDLVALGTVADLAPLQGENRLLVIGGLEVLRLAQRPGVAALARVAGLQPGNITAESISFMLGPRINAAGRLSHAYTAAKLLAAATVSHADNLAAELNRLNQERRRLTTELSRQAETLIEPEAPLLLAVAPEFTAGVVGLVASNLAEKYYRPTIVAEMGEAESRGSCRSIAEFHITEALDQVADLLVRHGGHAQAAGFTIRNENLAAFHERMTTIAAAELDGRDLQPTLVSDAELHLAAIDWALFDVLKQLEPTGAANATPVFVSHRLQVISHRCVGHDGAHLQLQLGDGRAGFRAIAFGQGHWAGCLPGLIDVVYTVNVNEWNGRRSLQLSVLDIREHQGVKE